VRAARRVFLAGASGVIGRRLVKLLNDAGHNVFGTTRREDRAASLRDAGATPIILDIFDATALSAALLKIRPEIVIHQLTDLPPSLDPSRMDEAVRRNAYIRTEGTRILVAAAIVVGTRRIIAQSIAWAYAPGPEPHREGDPLDVNTSGSRAVSIGGVSALEELTLNSPPLDGIVLRYGHLYGPGTGAGDQAVANSLHVDAAAHAASLAINSAELGIFNIAEPSAYVSSEKAQRHLGWDSRFRLRAE
jgi:nucleoside-diphosphate-sugar epimerase